MSVRGEARRALGWAGGIYALALGCLAVLVGGDELRVPHPQVGDQDQAGCPSLVLDGRGYQ